MPRILDSLPVLYSRLFPALFEQEVPAETKATCASCAMCESTAREVIPEVDGERRFFRPDAKCCTYHPRLPNFLVGALLCDEDPAFAEGRRRVEAKIAARAGVTPQWLKPPAKYTLLYDNARRAFGRAEALLCPYFEKGAGNCTIWPYREAVCSTYFCKFVAGADGRKFYGTMKSWITLVEIQLSRYAAFKLFPEHVLAGKDREGAAPLSPEDLDDAPPAEGEYKALWQSWVGMEAEFYRGCYEIVQGLSAADLERLLGFDGEVTRAMLTQQRAAMVTPKLPETLRFNLTTTIKWLPDGSVAMASYSDADAIALPGEAYALLVQFTGKEKVATVRERLRRERQADLDDEVLLTLYQHRILTD